MAKFINHVHEMKDSPLDYELYVQAYHEGVLGQKIADHFNRSIEEVLELARDPSHGGKTTVSSFIEAMVGFELERDGVLGISFKRGVIETNLIDGWERMWDVTAPPSLKNVDFNVEVKQAVESILRKFSKFPNGNIGILLCCSFLKKENLMLLETKLQPALTENQRFLVRLVHIDGVL